MRSSCERGEADCSTCSRGGAAPADCSSCSTSSMETWDQTHTYSNYQPICYHNPHMGQQHKQTNNLVNQQAEDGRLGCAEVSSTSEREGCLASQKDGQNQREMGGAGMPAGKEGHQENFGSIITMLSEITANQCDLDEFLTDQGALHGDYRTHSQHVDPQQRTMVDTHVSNMQTEVKQEHPELDYTYMGPTQDYYSAYHPRTNIPHIPHQDGSGSVDNMYRPRSISSVSSGSEGADGSLGSEGPDADRGYDRGAHYSRMDQLPPQGVVLGIKSENKTKDEKYWERRRKNNLAAKKSRDARRVRENQLRLRVLCLENANRVLRSQVDREHEENVYLREKLQKIEQEKQPNPVPS